MDPRGPTKPTVGARVALAVANLAGSGASAYAAARSELLSSDVEPLALVFWGLAAACLLLGLPAALSSHRGLRSLSRALAAVGVAVGGTASVIATVLS